MPADARGRRWNIVHMLLPGAVLAAWALAPADLEPSLASFVIGGGAMILLGALGWAIGEGRRNHSIMDIVYPMISFGTAAAIVASAVSQPTPRNGVMKGLILLWLLRLARPDTGTTLKLGQ